MDQIFGSPQEEHAPLGYKSNSELMEEERIQKEFEQGLGKESPVISGLAAYVHKAWQAAKLSKESGIQERMLKSLRQRMGVHDPDVAALMASKGSNTVYMMLTDEKCTALESWLEEILMPADDTPFSATHTADPELPDDKMDGIRQRVYAEAAAFMEQTGIEATPEEMKIRMTELEKKVLDEVLKKAEKNAEKVHRALVDILEEADWRSAFKEFMYYFVTFPVSYAKGPVLRTRPALKWGPDGPIIDDAAIHKDYDIPHPFDIYPSPNSRGIDDGYLIERHRLTKGDLYSLIGTDSGYDDEAIREVLSDESGQEWLDTLDSTRDLLEGRNLKEIDPEGRIDALQFWGSVSGKMLKEWGLEGVELDEAREYEAEVWLINNTVIKAVLNPDPLGKKPYFKASFRELYGQFYGISLPEVIRDCQLMCNATANNLANNMSLAAGPQVGVDVSQMPEGEDYTNIFPLKVWPFDLSSGPSSAGGRQPIWFFNAPSLAGELLQVYQHFSNEADTKSGVPKYSYGTQEKGGPLSTASGFRMMMDNTARGISKVIRNIDQGVIRPMVSHLFQWQMLYDEDFRSRYRGDIKIVARGSSALATKEQRQVILSHLLQTVLSSEDLKSMLGMDGLADIFRKLLAGTDVGVGDTVPSDDEIAVMEEQRGQEAQRQKEMAEQMALEKHQAEVEMMRAQTQSMLANAQKQAAEQPNAQ